MNKDSYETLKKKHPQLPQFEQINSEFEILTIEKEEFLLREIKRKIGEKIEPVLELLERLIVPDGNSFTDLHECQCYTKQEKKQILDVFRKLMQQHRMLLHSDLILEDENDALLISKITEDWKTARKEIAPLIKKLSECWERTVEPSQIVEYFG